MVYSASIAQAEVDKDTGFRSTYYVTRHVIFLVVGLIGGFIAFNISTKTWQQYAPALFILGVLLLGVVLVPGIGREVNGSRRWLSLVVINLQPSEIMKFVVPLYAADYTVRKAAFMGGKLIESITRGLLPMLVVMLVVGSLLLLEPDFGAFAVITAITMGLLFLGGFNWRLFAGLIVALAAGFVGLVVSSPYRMQRVLGFLDPWKDPFGKGYQLSHSLIAFGRGEWTGVGLGASVEKKLSYLPEAHTDFLMAIIAEELGFIGVASVVLMFAFLVLRAFFDWRAGGQARPCLSGAGGARHRHLVCGAVGYQYRREYGPDAHQGSDLAAAELWRLRHRGQSAGAGRIAARRF